MLGRTTIGDLSYVEEEWTEKVRVRVGEGGKWTVLRHCRGMGTGRGLLSGESGRDCEGCLRMGRGNARFIGDIEEGEGGRRGWMLAKGGGHGGVIKVVVEVGDGIKERLFGCCGTNPPEHSPSPFK